MDTGVVATGRELQMEPIKLPTSIVSAGDARRLQRDLAKLEETIQAIRLRTNAPVAKLPRLSRALEEFASTNRLNFLMPDDRHHAKVFVDYVLKKAPIMHISFASEATRKFTTELIVWLRSNYDTEMLIEIGLEPNIAAGSVVRTANKMFDFSLIHHLKDQRPMLMEHLRRATGSTEPDLVVAPPFGMEPLNTPSQVLISPDSSENPANVTSPSSAESTNMVHVEPIAPQTEVQNG